jgi:hypothetical protein
MLSMMLEGLTLDDSQSELLLEAHAKRRAEAQALSGMRQGRQVQPHLRFQERMHLAAPRRTASRMRGDYAQPRKGGLSIN